MLDQLIIGDKNSYDDFGASLASRKIGTPAKKKIRETIPFSNITYDFSKINGEIYWEDRELEYVFEMTAETPEKLEDTKAAFSDWVMNVFQEKLHDPFIPDFHFIATYESMSYDDEKGLDKTTATVKFTAYPYKIANIPCSYLLHIPSDSIVNVSVVNNSSHPITVTFKATSMFSSYTTVCDGETEIAYFRGEDVGKLQCGLRHLSISSQLETDIEITYVEEVL